MKTFGIALVILMLLVPALAAGQADFPVPDPAATVGADTLPWLTAQAAPPPPPLGPGPQPSRRPPADPPR